MALYELGLLKNGMLIYEKSFYHLKNLRRISQETKGQFLDAIFNMTKVSMKESINTLKLKQYKIVFKSSEKIFDKDQPPITYLVYVIGDKRLNSQFCSKILTKLMDLYLIEFEQTPSPYIAEKIPEGSAFDEKITKIIGDFYATSIDRMSELFF
ncbi:MAG: hypothetical protein EU530_04760 [Promethearchaeota archaeon]|nr:MAG: hypothetical protein EU530_04760 [Candidatus Lokiarchaeota archaeon]